MTAEDDAANAPDAPPVDSSIDSSLGELWERAGLLGHQPTTGKIHEAAARAGVASTARAAKVTVAERLLAQARFRAVSASAAARRRQLRRIGQILAAMRSSWRPGHGG